MASMPMTQWGREHLELAQTLGFTREQAPCVATLHLVFSRLDKAAFEAALKDGALEGPGDGGEEETTHAVTSLGQLKPMPRGCKRSGGVIGEPRTETTTYKMSP
jgi:hypothetical protein